MNENSERLVRVEAAVEQHNDLLQRLVVAMEGTAITNERLANHIEGTKRLWDRLDDYDTRISALSVQQGEICTFCNLTRKVAWTIATVATGGLAYLVKFWMDRHGLTP